MSSRIDRRTPESVICQVTHFLDTCAETSADQATTGLRQGDLLGLRWKEVDLDASVLSVGQTCQWLTGKGFTFGEPKSRKSLQAVTLPGSAVEALRHHRATQLEERLAAGPAYVDRDLVFADPVGRPTHISTLRKYWLAHTAAIGLSGLRFHDLRHTHASLLLQQGVHAKVVSERLGHATTANTMDTYSHVAPGLQVDAARRFDEGLPTLRLLAI